MSQTSLTAHQIGALTAWETIRSNPLRAKALKAWRTRRVNKQVAKDRRRKVALKAWETRRANQEAYESSFPTR
jgi:hypothetical protein